MDREIATCGLRGLAALGDNPMKPKTVWTVKIDVKVNVNAERCLTALICLIGYLLS